jgi:hypothetical protein
MTRIIGIARDLTPSQMPSVDRYENGARSQGYDVHFLGQNRESEQVYHFRLL